MKRGIETFLRFDGPLLFSAVTLTVFGLLALYGVAISRDSADFLQFKKHIIAAVIGFALVAGSAFIDYRQLRSFALPLFIAGALLLASVLIFGETIRGTRGWFIIGQLSFQPVEIAKIILILFLAAYVSRHSHTRMGWIPLVGSGCATAFYVGLVMLQPDFGSAVVMIAVWFVMVLFAGLPKRALLILVASFITIGVLMWSFVLAPYQKNRIRSFVDPMADPRGAGYNVTQARIAIGSGGLFGKGLAEGSQSRLHFLPEASTDFVFSVIGEELGFAGILLLLGLFALLLFRLIHIARQIQDPFGQLILVGLVSFIAFHLLVNAGMNVGIMPVTGIPLPFLSAGSSSLLVAFLAVALAEAIAIQRMPAAFR
ncbi:MAG: rod shape-determining protein RodA [bacterium]|nr:rod shape-determining protein RodA [bacterium]